MTGANGPLGLGRSRGGRPSAVDLSLDLTVRVMP